MIRALALATHNAGKRREIAELLAPLDIKVVSAAELNLPEPEETGDTFRANALLKAQAAAERANMPALADDSGLCIPALGGAPGVHSARWAGDNRNYAAAFRKIEHELAGHDAAAYFSCVLCLQLPHSIPSPSQGEGWGGGYTEKKMTPTLILPLKGGGNNTAEAHFFEGRVDGRLVFPPRGEQGFGYDPIFMPEGSNITFGQMPLAEKQALSHRAHACAALVEFLRTLR